MPRGDRTGPFGAGPMTGRGAGYCAGYGMPGYANPVFGRGHGPGGGYGFHGGGFGRGRGRGWQFYMTGLPGWARGGYGYPVPAWAGFSPFGPHLQTKDELSFLKEEAKLHQEGLEEINNRIAELEKKMDKKQGKD